MMACKISLNTQIDNYTRCFKCNNLPQLSILGELSTSFVSVKPKIEPINVPVKNKSMSRITPSREKTVNVNNLPLKSKRSAVKHTLSGSKRSPKRSYPIDQVKTVQDPNLKIFNVKKSS